MDGLLGKDDLLWLLGSLSQLHRQPFDPKLIVQGYPPPVTLTTFHEAARALGYKTGSCPVAGLDWSKLPQPAIAFLRSQAEEENRASADSPATETPSPWQTAADQPQADPSANSPEPPPEESPDAVKAVSVATAPAAPKGEESPQVSQVAQNETVAITSQALQTESTRTNSGNQAQQAALSQLQAALGGSGIALNIDSAVPQEPPAPPLQPILILKADAERILFFRPGSQIPDILPVSEAESKLQPELILITRERSAHAQPGEEETIAGFETEKKPFGFSWFIPELLKHRTIWRDVLTASLAIQLVGLATPLFTQVIIDKVVVHQTKSTLWVLGIALVLFMLFTSGMTWLRQYLVLHTGNRIDAVLGSQVLRHLLRLPQPYFEHRPTGTLVARLHGVETIREFVSSAAITLVLDFPFLLIFLAVMFAYSWQLSLIAVGLLSLICIMSLLVVPVFREKLNRQFMLGARNQSFLTEYIAGMSTVKALQMEADIDKKYGDLLAQYLAAGFSTKQVGNTYNVIANGLEQVMTLAILIVGALLVMQNEGFTVGMLVAFQMFASRMSQPMLRLVGLWQQFQQADIAVKRLGDILDMPQEPHTLTPQRENSGKARIDLKNLAFRYSENHPWLYQNLNLSFNPGHLTVLMGPSGCGKSTLGKLLLGFYAPSEGCIQIDGKDIRFLAANELRSIYGVVPQETVLFAGTIYDNLVMAHPHASFEDVIEACKLAEIHDVIEHLPQGYQTEIGERGVGLSGGQLQRLAIARALLKRPKVLLFDEAVSNLDHQTAEHFAKTINKLKGKVTMLFITHQIPRGLQVDEVIQLGTDQHARTMKQMEGREE